MMAVLGRKGTRALERLMGMVLIMIAIQMFLDGLDAWAAARGSVPEACG